MAENLKAVLSPRFLGRDMTSQERDRRREEIFAARENAVRRILSGDKPSAVAEDNGVGLVTLGYYLLKYFEGGFEALRPRPWWGPKGHYRKRK